MPRRHRSGPRLRAAALIVLVALAALLAWGAAPGAATEPAPPADATTAPVDEAADEQAIDDDQTAPDTEPSDGSVPDADPQPTVDTPTRQGAVRAPTLSISLNRSTVTYGQSVVASGTLAPAAAGPMTIERKSGTSWIPVATTTTDAAGAWSATFTPTATWTIRARMDDDSATSDPATVKVTPKFTLQRRRVGTTFVGVAIRARVQPASYRGKVRVAVRYAGRTRARATFRPRNGHLDVTLPAPGYGRMGVTTTLAAANGLRTARATFAVRARHPNIHLGSSGRAVRGLARKLRQLHFHVPRTTRFDARMGDVILALHKSQRMTRSSSMSEATWHRITRMSPLRPRYRAPYRHIEVDKRRQILMVVENGTVKGTLHVSTGATGNTPVGRWTIYQMGGSYLYKFMAFVGNYGIHGYVPVPAFPASHGCVREPMWAAAWTFSQSRIGTRVFIYT